MDSAELHNLIGYCSISVAGIIIFILFLSLILIFKIRHDRRQQPIKCPRCHHVHYGLCYEKNIFGCEICGHEHIGREYCNNFIWIHGRRPPPPEGGSIDRIDRPSPTITDGNNITCLCPRNLFFCPCNLTRSGFLFASIQTEYMEHDQTFIQSSRQAITNYYDLYPISESLNSIDSQKGVV